MMATTFPGTTIEATSLEKGSSKHLFNGIFAAGGITLSQVSIMTGLEPYLIQNWVKRGFVSSPIKRVYNRKQFARIIIINMLRETLQIERICNLIQVISGVSNDESDDLIGDDELYHIYVDMISNNDIKITHEASVKAAAENAVADFNERVPFSKKQLVKILQTMLYAHSAAQLRKHADEMISALQ